MATVTTKKISFNIKLNNGTDAEGNVKTVTLQLGKLSIAGYNDDKALALANLLQPCLDKSIHATEKVVVSTVTSA